MHIEKLSNINLISSIFCDNLTFSIQPRKHEILIGLWFLLPLVKKIMDWFERFLSVQSIIRILAYLYRWRAKTKIKKSKRGV